MPEKLKLPGLIEDPRSEAAKQKDYQHIELAPQAVVLNWNRGPEGAPIYSDRDQNGSGSCVAQASSTALETMLAKIISAHPIYARRFNKPGAGMWLQDAGNIIKNFGTTTEDKDPSQKMTEDQMNKPVTVETPINGFLYAFPDITNIDQIAAAIEVRKHCDITINGNLQEYAYSEKPRVVPGAKLDCPHCICGIYYFTDANGEKCILTKESWGPNNIRIRHLTESYLKSRGTAAMYFIPPIPPPVPVKPKFHFTVPLTFGMMNSLGVKNLQDILKYENLMDIKVTSTGNYLQITAGAYYQWQIKHNVAPLSELNAISPLGGRVGAKGIIKLNELYN